VGEPRDPLHCTRSSVHGRVSTRYAKFETDQGHVLHRRHSPTCPHTVFCGVSAVGLYHDDAHKLKPPQPREARSRDTPSPRLGYSKNLFPLSEILRVLSVEQLRTARTFKIRSNEITLHKTRQKIAFSGMSKKISAGDIPVDRRIAKFFLERT
jgi:hypothetical protein